MLVASIECKGTYDKCLDDTKRFDRMLNKYQTMPVTTPKYRKYYDEIIDYQDCD